MRIKSEVLGKKLSFEDILDLHAENPEVTVERDASGAIVLKRPSDYHLSVLKADLAFQLNAWNRKSRKGLVIDVPSGFLLPNGSLRSPDIAWVSLRTWRQFQGQEPTVFAELVPDFVIELHHQDLLLPDLIRKMKEYQSTGVSLGWLIDPANECVYIFRKTGKPVIRSGFNHRLSGEEVLAGFELDLDRLNVLRSP